MQVETPKKLTNIADGLIGLAASRSGSALGIIVSAILSIPAPAPWIEAVKIAGLVAAGAAYLGLKVNLEKSLATKPGFDPATCRMDQTDGAK